jgi:hypothetical protein
MFKFLKWFLIDQFMLGVGGGGGGGAPTQTTSTAYNTNIPEYARPYVETMLGATQRQLFDMNGNEITGFRPYQPYSTDPTKYVAGFQPLQEQAMRATGQLRAPGEYGAATGLASTAGLGGLGLARQMAGAGQEYAQMATSPEAQQAYMSPYMQNVVDYQKMQAVRDYGIATPMRRAQAVGQGAFGGSRQAIMESEAERSLMNQLQGIEAQGRQSAFQQAQQAQQFGANLGLQGRQAALGGLGAATQAAGALGQLGGQQLSAQKDIIGLQSQMGAQQQAREQQIINQAIQDWANTQQYPLMQLGVMSNMLRGLPMQSATTNQYVAAPNALTQGIGTIGAIGSLGNVFRGGKEGGMPSEFKAGIKSFDVGGEVESKLYDMDEEGLQKYIQSTTSDTARKMARRILREKTAPGMASGGIVAFKNPDEDNNQGVVKEDPEMVRRAYIDAAKLDADARAEAEAKAKADIAAENQRLLGRSPAPSTPAPVAAPAPSSVRVGRAGIPVAPNDSPRMRAARAAESAKGYTPSADELASFAEQEKNLAQSRAASALPGRTETTTIPGTSTVTNVPQTSSGAPPAAPAPAGIKAAVPAAAPTGIKTGNPELDKYIETTLKEANAPEKSVSELAAERRAYIGPDEATQKERARLMAERVNAKEEATRQNWMRMAEFFAAWGTTPGNSIVAGLTALKAKVPDFITDAKEQKKILKEIDGSIYGLDKVERLEKAGEFDKATELKQKLSADLKGKVGNIITFQASNLSSQRSLEAARTRAEAGGSGIKYNDLQRKVLEGIDRAMSQKDYQQLVEDSKIPVTEKSPQMLKDRVANAKAGLAAKQAEFEKRKRDVGITEDERSPSASAPSANVVDFSKLPK